MNTRLTVSAFLTLALLSARAGAGQGAPRREDMPKYINMLKTPQSAKDRARAAEQIGRRGAIQLNDVREAIPLLQKSATKDVDANVRRASAEALGRMATDASLVLSARRVAWHERLWPPDRDGP